MKKMDTQWSRYYVFDQPKEGDPHQHAGSVHASDPEMALMNARDVFTRRPYHFNLWVVPADAVISKTSKELVDVENHGMDGDPDAPVETYLIFHNISRNGTSVYVGDVEAKNPLEAFQAAVKMYPDPKVLVWWVIPNTSVTRSQPDEFDDLFSSASDKAFRHATHYPVVTLMREVRAGKKKKPAKRGP